MTGKEQIHTIYQLVQAEIHKAVEERTEGLRNMCRAADSKIHRLEAEARRLEADHADICKRHKSEVARSERLRDENKKLRVENETLHRIADELTPLPGRAEPGKTQQLAAALDRAHEGTAHSTMRFGPASPPSHPEPPRDDEGRPYPFSEPGDEPNCEDCAHEYDEEMVEPCETCRGYSGFKSKPDRAEPEPTDTNCCNCADRTLCPVHFKRTFTRFRSRPKPDRTVGEPTYTRVVEKTTHPFDIPGRIDILEDKVKHLEQITLSVEERETKARLDKSGEGGG